MNVLYKEIQNDRIDIFTKDFFGKEIKIINADTTATGIPSKSIENKMQEYVPLYSNTHTNAFTGNNMSRMIENVRDVVAEEFHVNRDKYDILFPGNGCTMAVKQILHILGIYEHPENWIILISENEHHAVHLGCIQALHKYNCIFKRDQLSKINKGYIDNLLIVPTIKHTNEINATYLHELLIKLKKLNKNILCFFNHGSNVTGTIQDQKNINLICKTIIPNIIMAWDYACSFPYVDIDMQNDNTDIIVCSPHKCMGGCGCSGLLVYRKDLHKASYPFVLAGGITQYICESEQLLSFNQENLESAGTPNCLGILRIKEVLLKRRRYLKYIINRNNYLVNILYNYISKNCNNFQILDSPKLINNRLPIISIYCKDSTHYNLLCAILSDFFGIMTRGGLSCCSLLYQKYLPCCMNKQYKDFAIENIISGKGMPCNYGGLRITLNYFMTDEEVLYILKSLKYINDNLDQFRSYYTYNPNNNHWELTK